MIPGRYLLLTINDKIITKANKRSNEMQSTMSGKNFVMKGKEKEKSFTGMIGEEAIIEHFPDVISEQRKPDLYNYDLIINGLKIEVKTTQTKVFPEEHHDCKIWTYLNQNTDIIIFGRAITNKQEFDPGMYSDVFYVGWDFKKDFYQKARMWKKGDVDPSNNQIMRGNSWNVLIKNTRPMFELVDILYPNNK